MQRGRDIGVDIAAEVAALSEGVDWDRELAAVRDSALAYPAYYTQPFHAYPDGNLCWAAAHQVLSWTADCFFALLSCKYAWHQLPRARCYCAYP